VVINQFVDSLNSEKNSLRLFLNHQDKELQILLKRYYRKIRHCNLIIIEILDLMEQYQKSRDHLNEKIRYKNNYTLNPEEQEIHNNNSLLNEKLVLNSENFYIHAKILLDTVCTITGFFIKEIPENAKHNFSKHRIYLQKNP